MNELDKIYLNLLKNGIISLREATSSNDLVWCGNEAEHLHNIPSLIEESNLERHIYYFNFERKKYLEWVKSTGNTRLIKFINKNYIRNWERLSEIIGEMIENGKKNN